MKNRREKEKMYLETSFKKKKGKKKKKAAIEAKMDYRQSLSTGLN